MRGPYPDANASPDIKKLEQPEDKSERLKKLKVHYEKNLDWEPKFTGGLSG